MMVLPTRAVAAMQTVRVRELARPVVMVTFAQSLRPAMTASPMPVVRVTRIVLGQGQVQRVEIQQSVRNWSNAMMDLPMPAVPVTRIVPVLVQARAAVMERPVRN